MEQPRYDRAQRFVVQLPIRYKRIGGQRWFEGKTENISRSGMLFRAERVLKLRTAIQMSFTLPAWEKGKSPGEVLCQGRVVRTVAAVGMNGHVFAASIQRYRIGRQAQKTPEHQRIGRLEEGTGCPAIPNYEVLWIR